ncbi:chemotaxis protein CheW [Caballeronia sp. GAWG2-1]|uniref:chemotaxis protein CheW n=1 Tax=Caballeronia sp. GAWG2-1 TaxID=2921744 RepID=UPI0020289A8D|nr:chemotaxis protein CheW [Caballeronia sp. GAWG2-1]
MNARTPLIPDVIDDCWNRIGVRGDGSCPKLERYVHCRNCPVHESAAARVLDRVDAVSVVERFKGDAKRTRDAADAVSYLVFRIGGEWLGLPTACCAQVAQLRPVHTLPHRRNRAVLGVVNVRGRLLVCVSLARLFGIEESVAKAVSKSQVVDARELGRLLVVQRHRHDAHADGEGPLAFPVDAVDGVHRFSAARLQPVPATLAQRHASHTQALAPFKDTTVGLLDAERLIDSLDGSLG